MSDNLTYISGFFRFLSRPWCWNATGLVLCRSARALFLLHHLIFTFLCPLAIIRDVVKKRFEVYDRLEEAARRALEQEAAAKVAEERKKAEAELAAKTAEEAKAEQVAEQAADQKPEIDESGRETTDKLEDGSIAGEEAGSERAATAADTPGESGQNEPTEEAPPDAAEQEQ